MKNPLVWIRDSVARKPIVPGKGIVPKIRANGAQANGRQIALRMYKAAKADNIVSFQSFNFVPHREVNRQAIMGLVAHSRQMAKNNPFMKHFLRTIQRNVIGPGGLKMQSLAVRPDGTPDAGDRKAIESAWREWGKRSHCSVCGSLSWKALQDRAIKWAARDGVCFIREWHGPEFGVFGFQLQLMTIESLDLDYHHDLPNGAYIHGGIEYNKFNRAVAYHFFKSGRVKPYARSMQTERVRVDADKIHVITMNDDDVAGLGVPWAHATLRDMNQEEHFEESALVAARAGAAKMGFFTQTGAAAEAYFEAAGERAMSVGESVGEPSGSDPRTEIEIDEVSAGTLETLPVGYGFTGFDPGYPDAAIDPFLKVMFRRMAVGVGLSYATFTGDLSEVSFASMRRGVQEERDEYSMLQGWFIEVCCDPVFSNWLKFFLISDYNSNNSFLPFKVDKFSAVEWQGRGFESVDPLNDAQSNNMNIMAGLDSPQRQAARRGLDFETLMAENAEALKIAKTHGVTLNFSPSTMAKPADQSDSQEEATKKTKESKNGK